jgi:MFS-type transporter involved in bile tolerance (Atg22 family)
MEYLSGLLCLIICLFIFIDGHLIFWSGIESDANVRAAPLFVAAWVFIFSFPF